VFLDDNLAPFADQWEFLSRVRRIDRESLEELLERHTPAGAERETEAPSRYEDRALDLIPAAVKRGIFTGSVKAIRDAQLEIPVTGLPSCLSAALKRLATLANPMFFERQRLRFGTWNLPRFLFCGEIHPGRLVLPRGVVPAAAALFHKAGGRLEIEDRRPRERTHGFAFH